MNKNWKRALALGMATMVTLMGSSMTVLADRIGEDDYDNKATLTKILRVPDGLAIPGETFTFIFAPQTEENSGEASPDINNNTPGTEDDNKLSITFTAGEATTGPDSDGYYYVSRNFDNGTNENILHNTNFPHAGVYVYKVTEDGSAATTGMTYSPDEYTMRVYVKNVVDDVPGNSATEVAVDLVTFEKAGTKTNMVFTNTYTKTTDFEITKKVTGSYADPNKEFDYEIEFTSAPGTTPTGYNGTITHSGGGTTPVAITGTSGTFKLKHGDKLVFADLPVGTTYTLTELAATNYKASVVVSDLDNNDVDETATASAKNEALTIGDGGSNSNVLLNDWILIKDDVNKADWTNNYIDPPTPTGIIMNNLPFIMLIVLAIGGFVGYIAMKRRKGYR